MKTRKEQGEKMMRAVGEVGDDILIEAASDEARPKRSRKKLIFALIAAVLAISMIAGSVALIAASRSGGNDPLPGTTKPGEGNEKTEVGTETKDPIVFSGEAYTASEGAELPDCLSSVKVSFDGSDSRVISPTGSFAIETAGVCDEETLAKYMTVTPLTEFTITKVSEKKFLASPASGSLVPGTIYRVQIGDPEKPEISYAFQTESELVLKTSIPGDNATQVPVDTGIEFTFSETLSQSKFEDYVSFSPAVSGSFSLCPDGRTLLFLPNDNLSFDKVYTITVKEGIPSASGRTLKEGAKIRFRTQTEQTSTDNTYLRFNLYSGNVCAPGDLAYINYYAYGNYGQKISAKVKLYLFPDAETAYDYFKKSEEQFFDTLGNDEPIDIEGLELVYEHTYEDIPRSGSFDFGTELKKGGYLVSVEATCGKETKCCTAFLSISDLKVFTTSSFGQTLVYVLDGNGTPQKDLPVKGCVYSRSEFNIYSEYYSIADIGYYDESGYSFYYSDPGSNGARTKFTGFTDVSAVTGSDGVCFIGNGKENCALLIVGKEDDKQIVPVSASKTYGTPQYAKHVATDREIYFPNDRVNVFGHLTPLFGASLPEKLYFGSSMSAVKTPVALSEDGSFTCQLDIEDYVGWISLYIYDENERCIAYKYIRVTQENKPTLKASISFDRSYWRYAEIATGVLTLSFYDGTPASGYTFNFSCNYNSFKIFDQKTGQGPEMVTDENGEIRFAVKTGWISATSTEPASLSVTAELVGMETETICKYAYASYYHSDYVFRTKYEENERLLLLNHLDLTGYPESVLGKPADGSVNYELIKHVYVPHEETGYDSYTKRKYTYTTYTYYTETVKSGTLQFENGKISLPTVEPEGFRGYYEYSVHYSDGRNNFHFSVGASSFTRHYYNYDVWDLELNKENYLPGDGITASLLRNGEQLENVLFIRCGRGIGEYSIGKEYTGVYSSDMITGCSLVGVYFDKKAGSFKYDTSQVRYDYANGSSLEIEIKTDKEVYKPGEQATLTVTVKDAKGGKVLISVVDEACFALREQRISPLSDYFASMYNASVAVNQRFTVRMAAYTMNRHDIEKNAGYNDDIALEPEPAESAPDDEGRAGKGEDYIREYFADNPVFKVVELNGEGKGTLVFTVPDNITSWRLTADAVTGLGSALKDVRLGSTVSDIVCTLPFFASVSMNGEYIVGDDIGLIARCYGAEAKGQVKYTASLYNDAGELLGSYEKTANAGERCFFTFDSRDPGEYSVIVKAECGEFTDALRTKFTVLESVAMTDVTKTLTLENLKSLKPLAYPIRLSFYDNSDCYRFYLGVINALKYNGEARSDALIARYVASLAEARMFGTDTDEELKYLRKQLESFGNGVELSLLTYSSTDSELTALAAAVAPDAFGSTRRTQLVNYCSSLISNRVQKTEEALCAALLTLASFDEPILNTLCAVSSCAGNYPVEAKLFLAAAFAKIGDYPSARELLNALIEEKGVRSDVLYLDAGRPAENVRLTSIALIAAASVSREDAEMMAKYLLANRVNEERGLFGLAAYLREYAPYKKDNVKKVVYTLNGETFEKKITPFTGFGLTLGKRDYADLQIVSMDEGVGIVASYKGSLGDVRESAKEMQDIKIKKTVEYSRDNVYKVTLTISGKTNKIYNGFDLSDTIPSGARFLRLESGGNSETRIGNGVRAYASIWNRTGQKMHGYVNVYNYSYREKDYRETCPEYSFEISVSYYIRGAVEGSYVVEQAMLKRYSGEYATSARQSVKIFSDRPWEIASEKKN